MSRRQDRHQRPAWSGPLGLYASGTTWLHRLGPGAKSVGLAVVGLLVLVVRGPWGAVLLLAAVTVAAASAGLRRRNVLRSLLPILVTAGVVGLYQWWQRGPAIAVEVAAGLVTVVLAACVVTATTRSDHLLDALGRALAPLRHVGLPPRTVALSVALMIRSVPALLATAGQVRDAARARGLERSPRALLVPAAVRTVARARSTGEALAARGLGD
ncbi:energy-coupling factor transporter transmembrane protein EcfT [Actinotalea sp. K2]|uniref:energy-coupling factor transporter transmembrane component T family protein n=1 Tax=Actinotalea sp. K2 TaxID=2939438 RepID=UPI0020170E2E|nr:energy-coupling factor transporter transmembrane protein EcfT [Actinotalea sp. K2]MCL3861955.1 energy-coupling factor transporter transmembrane protein EcfT [Actinotalea sp. K2]